MHNQAFTYERVGGSRRQQANDQFLITPSLAQSYTIQGALTRGGKR